MIHLLEHLKYKTMAIRSVVEKEMKMKHFHKKSLGEIVKDGLKFIT